MNTWKRILALAGLLSLGGCSLTQDDSGFYIFNYSADFNASLDEWTGDFADYPAGESDSIAYELEVGIADLPQNLGSGKALKISGYNYSDDLFMFIKRKVSGLSPYTDYTIVFGVELASNAPVGNAGAGGAPGESVFLKVGAVAMEPKKIIEGDYYRMNIDIGNQNENGEDMMIIGNIAVGANINSYTLIERDNTSNNAPRIIRTNSKGELWLIIGTDSGFKGLTTLYYTRVNVVFSLSN